MHNENAVTGLVCAGVARADSRTGTIRMRPARCIRHVRLHRWLMGKIANLGLGLSSALLRLLPVQSLGHTAASELCSCLQRIAELYSRGFALPADAGLVWEQDANGHLQMNKRTQARIQYMQKRRSESCVLSTTDLRLLLQGWDAGEEWRSRTSTGESNSNTSRP